MSKRARAVAVVSNPRRRLAADDEDDVSEEDPFDVDHNEEEESDEEDLSPPLKRTRKEERFPSENMDIDELGESDTNFIEINPNQRIRISAHSHDLLKRIEHAGRGNATSRRYEMAPGQTQIELDNRQKIIADRKQRWTRDDGEVMHKVDGRIEYEDDDYKFGPTYREQRFTEEAAVLQDPQIKWVQLLAGELNLPLMAMYDPTSLRNKIADAEERMEWNKRERERIMVNSVEKEKQLKTLEERRAALDAKAVIYRTTLSQLEQYTTLLGPLYGYSGIDPEKMPLGIPLAVQICQQYVLYEQLRGLAEKYVNDDRFNGYVKEAKPLLQEMLVLWDKFHGKFGIVEHIRAEDVFQQIRVSVENHLSSDTEVVSGELIKLVGQLTWYFLVRDIFLPGETFFHVVWPNIKADGKISYSHYEERAKMSVDQYLLRTLAYAYELHLKADGHLRMLLGGDVAMVDEFEEFKKRLNPPNKAPLNPVTIRQLSVDLKVNTGDTSNMYALDRVLENKETKDDLEFLYRDARDIKGNRANPLWEQFSRKIDSSSSTSGRLAPFLWNNVANLDSNKFNAEIGDWPREFLLFAVVDNIVQYLGSKQVIVEQLTLDSRRRDSWSVNEPDSPTLCLVLSLLLLTGLARGDVEREVKHENNEYRFTVKRPNDFPLGYPDTIENLCMQATKAHSVHAPVIWAMFQGNKKKITLRMKMNFFDQGLHHILSTLGEKTMHYSINAALNDKIIKEAWCDSHWLRDHWQEIFKFTKEADTRQKQWGHALKELEPHHNNSERSVYQCPMGSFASDIFLQLYARLTSLICLYMFYFFIASEIWQLPTGQRGSSIYDLFAEVQGQLNNVKPVNLRTANLPGNIFRVLPERLAAELDRTLLYRNVGMTAQDMEYYNQLLRGYMSYNKGASRFREISNGSVESRFSMFRVAWRLAAAAEVLRQRVIPRSDEEIQKYDESIAKTRDEYFRLTQGTRADIRDQEPNIRNLHTPDPNYLLRPEFTGEFKLVATIVSSIENAYSKVVQYVEAMRDATLDLLIRAEIESGLPGAFARIVAALYNHKQLTFPSEYKKDIQYARDAPDRHDSVLDIYNYEIVYSPSSGWTVIRHFFDSYTNRSDIRIYPYTDPVIQVYIPNYINPNGRQQRKKEEKEEPVRYVRSVLTF
jgi:hypothetical protein